MVLRITRDNGSAALVTVKLEGRLEAAFTSLLVGECLALLDRDGAIDIDLSGIVMIDSAGVDALWRLSRAGATIRECSELVASILEDAGIDVERGAADGDRAVD